MPTPDATDLRWTIVPKSDQLNAEQLLGGPMTILVTGVEVHDSAEQPISIRYEGDDGRPYKPAKTMRKVLIFAWGQDGFGWRGKSMTLYNDPSIKFGGTAVGGIRISHMSDIAKNIEISLTATKGKKALHTIKVLKAAPAPKAPTLQAALSAISAASTPDDMTAARGLVGALASPDDKAKATAAFKARLADLKAAAKPVKTLEQWIAEVEAAADAAAADAILAAADLPADQLQALTDAHAMAWL